MQKDARVTLDMEINQIIIIYKPKNVKLNSMRSSADHLSPFLGINILSFFLANIEFF